MFYKYEDSILLSGDIVTYPDGTLLHLNHMDEVTLPFDGWYFFETEEEARNFLDYIYFSAVYDKEVRVKEINELEE